MCVINFPSNIVRNEGRADEDHDETKFTSHEMHARMCTYDNARHWQHHLLCQDRSSMHGGQDGWSSAEGAG